MILKCAICDKAPAVVRFIAVDASGVMLDEVKTCADRKCVIAASEQLQVGTPKTVWRT